MKKIVSISLGILLVIILAIVIAGRMKNAQKKSGVEGKNGQVVSNATSTTGHMSVSTRAEKEHITNREAAIRNFYDFPEDFSKRKTVINGRTFFVFGYSWGHDPNTGDATRGGVLVFEKMNDGNFNLFWESKESIDHGEYTRFRDLTNDGIPEIVNEDSPGVSGSVTAYIVYAWRDGTFKIVVPINPIQKWSVIRGSSAETGIEDIDNDKILEIIAGYIDDNRILHQEIYKWNGKEYYLWKEEIQKPE